MMRKRYFRLGGYLYQEEANYFAPLSGGAEEVTETDYQAYMAGIEAQRQADDAAEEAKVAERWAKRGAVVGRLAERFQLTSEEVELLFGVL